MNRLSNEEFILLDTLIYLEWEAEDNEKFVNVIDKLLDEKELKSLIDRMSSCIVKMKIHEWINVLTQAKNKSNLCELKIKNIENHKNGMRVACFIDNDDNAIVVFRGTTTQKEWEDNGQGAYEYDTIQQVDALKYINNLSYENIIVTGHSKGGNKAQYVTILSPKVNRCISVNGQGFSNEFLNRYKEEIENNKLKIISINAKYDYVNCLFNDISNETHYIKTELQLNPFNYHRTDILLNQEGNIREEVSCGIFTKIINDFSTSLISDLPEEIRFLTIDGLIGGIELILCKGESSDRLIKIIGGIVIMVAYGQYFKYKETFLLTYTILQGLILPLMFWNDFINIEEENSEELFSKVTFDITMFGNEIIEKLNNIDGSKNPVTKSVIKAITNLIEDIISQQLLI